MYLLTLSERYIFCNSGKNTKAISSSSKSERKKVMKQTIKAEFETLDSAERAAVAISKNISSARGTHVYPKNPESVQLTIPHEKRYTLLPTAVASMNYITALVETDYNFEDMNEEKQRQTSYAEFSCDSKDYHNAEQIILQMGGDLKK